MNNNKPETSTVKNQDDIKTIYPSKNTNQETSKNTMIIHINNSLQKNNHTASSSQRKKSKIPVKLKNYPLSSKSSPTSSTKSGLLTNASSSKSSFKSKIPQFQPQQHSQTLIDNKNDNNKSGEELFNNKYGTYTKKKPSNTSASSTSMINSITFDKNSANDRSSNRNSSKLECNEVKILLTNPNQSQTIERQNILDIVLVPINDNINENRENETTNNSLEIMTTPKDTSRVKIRDDEGYSTMSSELMHQIKPNPADLSARSSISTRKGIKFKKVY